jgi:hypothetical protein
VRSRGRSVGRYADKDDDNRLFELLWGDAATYVDLRKVAPVDYDNQFGNNECDNAVTCY